MKVNGQIIKCMEKESIHGLMDNIMKGIGKMGNSMEKEHFLTKIIYCKQAFGKKAKKRKKKNEN